MKYKIIHKRKDCVGCGACVAACPNNWFIDKDGKASPKKKILDKIDCNKDAADACPFELITIEEFED
ncbi:MAG: ferredoxin [Candidatus Nanoarchaeia archaeon]